MAKKAKKEENFLDFIVSEMGSKDVQIMSSDSAESLIPWRVPFRHLGLQKATGGLLGGKMMEIQGDSQCLAEGTLVATLTGPKPIEKLKVGDSIFGFNKDGTVSPTKVVRLFDNGEREVYQLKNKHRIMAESTLEHKWGTLTTHGSGDTVLGEDTLDRIRESRRKFINRRFVDYDIKGQRVEHAYAIGALLGDGCSRQGVSGIHISSRDEKIPNKVKNILGASECYRQSPSNYTYVIANGTGSGYNHETVKCDFYDDHIKGKYAGEKTLPKSVLVEWDRESILNLIAGLIDTDGSVYLTSGKYLNVTFTSTSASLGDLYCDAIYKIFQVRPRLHIDEREDKTTCFQYILGDNFTCKRVIKTLDSMLESDWKKYKPEYDHLSEHISDYIGIETGESRWARTYDIQVDNETHLYVLHDNGLITHNSGKSFLAYELMASTIDAGGVAYLCDSEQAYEPAYGEKIGISKNGFLYTSETSIEVVFAQMFKFMQVARSKIKDRSIPLIMVIDSFAALRTKDQLKADEAGKDASGFASSRKNILFYDKLVAIAPMLTEYSASLVILNQLRTNHQIMFGDKTTSLAETMKYYMTQRIRGKLSSPLYKIIKIDGKDTKIQIGMSANWQTIKNRFVEPFKKVKVETLFTSGMKPKSGLLTLLLHEEQVDVVEKAVLLKSGEEGKKKEQAFKPKGSDKAYTLSEIPQMLIDFPELLEPAYTKLSDETEEYIEGEEATVDEE